MAKKGIIRKGLAYLLSAAMALTSVDAMPWLADTKSAEAAETGSAVTVKTLKGVAWWNAGNEKTECGNTFYIYGVGDANPMSFDVTDGTHTLSVNPISDAWWFNVPDAAPVMQGKLDSDVTAGQLFKVTVVKSGSDFTVTIHDVADNNKEKVKITASSSAFSDDITVVPQAQGGSIMVIDTAEEISSVIPVTDGTIAISDDSKIKYGFKVKGNTGTDSLNIPIEINGKVVAKTVQASGENAWCEIIPKESGTYAFSIKNLVQNKTLYAADGSVAKSITISKNDTGITLDDSVDYEDPEFNATVNRTQQESFENSIDGKTVGSTATAAASSNTPVYVDGYSGKGVSFSGAGSDGIELNIKPTSKRYVLSFWMNVNVSTQYTPAIFIANFDSSDVIKGDDTNAQWISIATQGHKDSLDAGPMVWSRNVPGNASWNDLLASKTGALSLNAWHKIAVAADGATAGIYVDGVKVGSGPIADIIGEADTTTKLFLGVNNWDTPFNGIIDELKITSYDATGTAAVTDPKPPTPPVVSEGDLVTPKPSPTPSPTLKPSPTPIKSETPAGVTLNKTSASMEIGDTLTLIATVSPEDAIEKGVTWSSDNESVATVDASGKVTAVKAGTAKITAASKENAALFAVCSVTVKEKSLPDDGDKILTDESQLGTYRSDLAYKRVGVHDPSVVRDPKTNRYYIFGSHCAWAWSDDLENWTEFKNNITEGDSGSANTIFADEIVWCKQANSGYSVTGNLWAPDVIWDSSYKNADGTTGAWLMYMSINGPDWNSTISLLTSDRLDGNWTYVGPVIQSGMSKGYGVTFDYEKVTGETTVNSRYTENVSGGGNPTLEAHAIDPCVLYDENGDLWMSYGSWSGGISMIKLDKETGRRDYSMTYADTNNKAVDGVVSDPYTGYKIAGGTAVSGEGSYIKRVGDYYFLFLSYGGFAPNEGYNMRVFRSKAITGPYIDVAGKDARHAVNTSAGNVTGSTGMRLMSYYKWNFADYGYTAQGHNSAAVDAAGDKAFVIYHNKYDDGTAAHEVRVHQLLTNEDGWILSAPFEYAGETVETAGYGQNVFTGDYGIMFQKQNVAHAQLRCTEEQRIKLEAGTETATGYSGKITGDYTGTWESKTDSPYITLKIGNTTYKGVFCEGTFDETDVEAMTFTAVGDNQECLWGYKVKDSTVAIRMTIDKVIKIPDTVATDIPLPTTGVGGSTITWKSNSPAIADDGTIPHLFNEDSTVSMTATITNGRSQFSKNYEFTVLGNTKLASESDVAIKKFYTDTELDMSKLAKGDGLSFPNPFHYTHEDISNGVSISFDAVRTTAVDNLSNLISFNNKLGRLYFTGGGYLGFNDFNGRFIDANLKGDYTVGKDYLPANTKVSITVEITSGGFTVYQNGTKVYAFADVKSGTVPGNIGGISPELTMLSWIKTAPELNFGSGNFWGDIFNGKISNVVCSYKQPAIDVNGGSSLSGLYVQDYESVGDISTEWQSTNAQGNLSIGSGDAGHGQYMLYDFTGEIKTNGRGAYSYFGDSVEWPDGYILEYDIAVKPGTDSATNQRSQIAVLTENAAYTSNVVNNGVSTGYVFKMAVSNKGIGEVNDDTNTANQVTLPNAGWVHIVLTGTKGSTTAHLKITDGDNVLYDKDVTATDKGAIKGLYILAGRYQAVFKVDNIVVKDQNVDYGVRSVYEKTLARAEQFVALQEESPVYTSDSYQALADAVAAAKDTVTNASTDVELQAHIDAMKAAIDALERVYYTVTVAAAENGTVTGLAADGKYFAGDSITLTAVPDTGYDFSGWKVGSEIVSKNTVYSAMVSDNFTITPVFEKSETPTPTPTPGDDTTPTPTPTPGGNTTPTPAPTGGSGSGGGGGAVIIPPASSSTPVPSITPVPSTTPVPSITPKPDTPSETDKPDTPSTPGASDTPSTPDVPGTSDTPANTPAPSSKNTAKKGKVYSVSDKKYKVTSVTSKKKTVTLTKVSDKSLKNLKVGDTVKIKNQSFKITAIAPKAFASCKKLETVTIGKNVISLGAQCFANCPKLRKVTFKTNILNAIGKNAFKGINKNAVIKVPKAKLKQYKKLLKKKVQPSTVRITK